MAELVDAADSKSAGVTPREGSIPFRGTIGTVTENLAAMRGFLLLAVRQQCTPLLEIRVKFCSTCGSPVEVRVPDDGDHLPRHVCVACNSIHYFNPKIIVGVIPEASDGRVLMCRRNIEPRKGMWTFPAGFMELGETSAQGAAREGLEESLAQIEVDDLLCIITVTYVSQVYMIHRGRLPDGMGFGPTTESSEVLLMAEADIPWGQIAFPTIYQSLKYFFADRSAAQHNFHRLDLTQRPSREMQAEITSWLAAAGA